MAAKSDLNRVELLRAVAAQVIDEASAELRRISLDIHAHPELNFQEHHAHALLTDYLESKGFEVTRGAYEMPTAFQAVAGSGSPTIAVMCEYDALPGIGHACGHNLIAISGVATALGLKAALGDGSGTIVVLGSPAEEGGGGKVFMIERGAFENVDAAMMLHPTPGDAAWANVIAIQSVEVDYFGRNAHASAFPWMGLNALDAIVMAYNGISVMRQQMRPTDRVHGVITRGGLKPNIIPDHTSAEFFVRAKNPGELEDVKAKVKGCFEAAALATGCRLEYRETNRPYTDLINNDQMAGTYAGHLSDLGAVSASREQSLSSVAASTDMGNVSYAVPAIHPMFGIPSMAGNHTPGFTDAAATPEAHQATIRASKALAMTALDLYLRPELMAAAKAEFRAPPKR